MALSKTSTARLNTCHPDIVRLVLALVEDGHEIQVIEGERTLERQKELIKTGASSIKNPINGKHVTSEERPLSDAIDMAPLPIDWKDTKRFYAFGEKVMAKAKELNIKIIWGGDWDSDGDYTDQRFNDLVHFERG